MFIEIALSLVMFFHEDHQETIAPAAEQGASAELLAMRTSAE